jgi:hypothetical protein
MAGARGGTLSRRPDSPPISPVTSSADGGDDQRPRKKRSKVVFSPPNVRTFVADENDLEERRQHWHEIYEAALLYNSDEDEDDLAPTGEDVGTLVATECDDTEPSSASPSSATECRPPAEQAGSGGAGGDTAAVAVPASGKAAEGNKRAWVPGPRPGCSVLKKGGVASRPKCKRRRVSTLSPALGGATMPQLDLGPCSGSALWQSPFGLVTGVMQRLPGERQKVLQRVISRVSV